MDRAGLGGSDLARPPAHKMKMSTEHLVPLSRQAVEVLRELYPLTGSGRYVFPSARSSGPGDERKRHHGGA